MNKKILVLASLFLICVGAVLITVLSFSYEKPDASYDMYLTVGDRVGFNTGVDAIWFGIVMQGGVGKRAININSDEHSSVVIKLSGELADWVTVSDNNFVLEAGENKRVAVTASVPGDAEFGNYTGKLNVYFRKV